jgi:hypothetical protein
MTIIRLLSMIVFTVVLANCGSQSVGSPAATPWPSATIEPTREAPTQTTTAAPTPTVIATIKPIIVVNTDDSLASGLTPEGYHVLGDMAAPITFIDYSDYF